MKYHYVSKKDILFNLSDSSTESSQDKDNLEINPKAFQELLINSTSIERDLYSIIEIINKVSITAIIIVFYLKVLKALQSYDLIQYTYFAFHLIDSNGLLVFLKILNQDLKGIEQQFINIYDHDVINIQFGELIEVILLNNLKLIYKTCYKNDDYIIKYLVECKVHIMLRKLLNNFPSNEKIKKSCLKLLKCQIKFFDKNWRLENANIITNIYLVLKITPEKDTVENFMKYERRDKNSKDPSPDYFSIEELKKIHSEYHFYNYTKFFNNFEEIEKYQNSIYHSLYANIYLKLCSQVILPDDYKENYLKYINY